MYHHLLPQSPSLEGGAVLCTSAAPFASPKIALQKQLCLIISRRVSGDTREDLSQVTQQQSCVGIGREMQIS